MRAHLTSEASGVGSEGLRKATVTGSLYAIVRKNTCFLDRFRLFVPSSVCCKANDGGGLTRVEHRS